MLIDDNNKLKGLALTILQQRILHFIINDMNNTFLPQFCLFGLLTAIALTFM